MIDVKGDLPNLLLRFPTFAPEAILPWVDGGFDGGFDGGLESTEPTHKAEVAATAARLAEERRVGLSSYGVNEPELAAFSQNVYVRVVTPGADSGELLHVLSSLERRSPRWDTDREGARAALSAAISLVLRLLGRDPDPAKSREHVLLSLLAERRLLAGHNADLGSLLADVVNPPLEEIGALSTNEWISKKARKDLAAGLNTLLASPTFECSASSSRRCSPGCAGSQVPSGCGRLSCSMRCTAFSRRTRPTHQPNVHSLRS